MTAIAETAAKTVLICEDDPNLRTLVRLALGDDGYRFFEAPDGPSGLALARRTQPDLIVLDLMLPGRSGLDVLRELRNARDFAETPVIVISALARPIDLAQAEVAGADHYLVKPFRVDALADSVCELIGLSCVAAS